MRECCVVGVGVNGLEGWTRLEMVNKTLRTPTRGENQVSDFLVSDSSKHVITKDTRRYSIKNWACFHKTYRVSLLLLLCEHSPHSCGPESLQVLAHYACRRPR